MYIFAQSCLPVRHLVSYSLDLLGNSFNPHLNIVLHQVHCWDLHKTASYIEGGESKQSSYCFKYHSVVSMVVPCVHSVIGDTRGALISIGYLVGLDWFIHNWWEMISKINVVVSLNGPSCVGTEHSYLQHQTSCRNFARNSSGIHPSAGWTCSHLCVDTNWRMPAGKFTLPYASRTRWVGVVTPLRPMRYLFRSPILPILMNAISLERPDGISSNLAQSWT